MQWHQGSIPEAINLAKKEQSVFVVFIAGDDEKSQEMEKSLETIFTSQDLSKKCVALKLEANGEPSKQFSQIYPVVVIPSTYFIGLNGVPLEVVGGQLDDATLLSKIHNVFMLHESGKSLATGPSSLSPSSAGTSAIYDVQMSEVIEPSASIDDRVERAKHLVAQRRELKAMEEEEKEKQKEIERRKIGKEVQKKRAIKQEQETRQVADEIARERAEERAAREKVREEIARDRAERTAKFNAEKAEQLERSQEIKRAKLEAEQEKLAADVAARSQFARLQFRMPDGSSATFQFNADAQLLTVFDYVKESIKPSFGAFTLSSSFPRREFVRSDFSQSLRDLQLTPSAAILILPSQSSAVRVYDSYTGLINFLWLFFSPLFAMWKMVQTFLFGDGQQRQQPPPPSRSTGSRPLSADPPNTSNPQRRAGPSGSNTFARQTGNVHRLADDSSEDNEDNNTWNGNSTQQM